MRPIDKGEAPEIGFKKYQDAEPELEKRIGPYCSYCEMPIIHVPEVEHKEAKSQGGEQLAWDNLLLSCKYCNTRKMITVKKGDLSKYIWPDSDDTFHAFDYSGELPKVAEDFLKKRKDGSYQKALNLFQLVKLGNIPEPGVKDRRFFERNEARNNAWICRNGFLKMKDEADKKIYLETIIRLAKASGFFSVWMTVFKDIESVRIRLINDFEGTRKKYFENTDSLN